MSQPSFMSENSLDKFTVLVVDDDSTSLSIVSAMLKSWKYDVMTMKSPIDALDTVRILKEAINLVVTDLHMPQMNGLELQKRINEEVTMPVIIMSSDDRESTILKCLASGVVFYIVKPVNPEDFKNVWQYAVGSKKGKSVFIEGMGSNEGNSSTKKKSRKNISSATSVNGDKKSKKPSRKRKPSEEAENIVPTKKPKVAWTSSLHDCFLRAIRHISLERAVPKRILELMNVPGLTRENVASHLQKYRLFLKRVAEIGSNASSKKLAAERALRSSFALGHSSLTLRDVQDYTQIREKQRMKTSSFQAGYRGNLLSTLNATNLGSTGFPNSGASSSKSVSQAGLFGNQTYQSLLGNTIPLYQANQTTYGTGSKGIGTDLLSRGSMSQGLMKLYQQKSQTGSDLYISNTGNSSFNNFGTSAWKPSFTAGYESMATLNNLYLNFGGIRLNDAQKFVGTSQTSQNANVLNVGYGLLYGTGNQDVTAAGFEGNTTFPYLVPGESSSSVFDTAFTGANEVAANTSVLPPLSQQQYGPGSNLQNGLTFGLMSNASVSGKSAHTTAKLGEGFNIDDFLNDLFDLTDCEFPYQQQGGEDVRNTNFPNTSYQAELNLPNNHPPVTDFSSAYGIAENVPWIEPSLEQLLEIEEVMNPDLGSNAQLLDSHSPSLDQNPNQHQGDSNCINNGQDQLENSPSGNQDSDDEFVNSLFCFHPFRE